MNAMTDPDSTYNFTLILSGFDRLSTEIEDALYGGGCDDAILGVHGRVPFLEFDRVADSLPDALLSAIEDVHGTGLARVTHVEPGDAVSAAEIARRTHRTRQSIQQLIAGSRGPGEFPSPAGGLRSHSPMWSWACVADWMHSVLHDKDVTLETVEMARFLALLNHTLAWPTWGSRQVAKQLYRCVQPQHKHSRACRERDWLSELQGA